MTEKLLLIDIDKCVGCYACEVACKEKHSLPLGPRWSRVFRIGPRKVGDGLHLDLVPAVCLHCSDPPCVHFCEFEAIHQREDGLVLIDQSECTGCELCTFGCPYGAISLNLEDGTAGKCSLCVDRIDAGLEPSCVQHCQSGALMYVDPEELKLITQGMHLAGEGKVKYTSSKWRLAI